MGCQIGDFDGDGVPDVYIGNGGPPGGVPESPETTRNREVRGPSQRLQVRCGGGAVELVKCGFETLVEAGYAPEMAYF